MILLFQLRRGSGGIGRRTRLRIWRHERGGSSPFTCTIFDARFGCHRKNVDLINIISIFQTFSFLRFTVDVTYYRWMSSWKNRFFLLTFCAVWMSFMFHIIDINKDNIYNNCYNIYRIN